MNLSQAIAKITTWRDNCQANADHYDDNGSYASSRTARHMARCHGDVLDLLAQVEWDDTAHAIAEALEAVHCPGCLTFGEDERAVILSALKGEVR